MKLDLPFEVGKTYWIPDCFSFYHELKCLLCDENGKVELKNGGKQSCQQCGGNGYYQHRKPFKFRPRRFTINYFDYHGRRNEFWLKETENQLYQKPEDLYTSFLECRKACRDKNKKYGWPQMSSPNNDYMIIDRTYVGKRKSQSGKIGP